MTLATRIKHHLSRAQSKWLLRHNEHVFHHQNIPVKYLFIPKKKSDTLVVVFSGMNPKRASYSYINLLNHLPHNRLYILDDYGDDTLGCFYLGVNGGTQVESAVSALIEKNPCRASDIEHVFLWVQQRRLCRSEFWTELSGGRHHCRCTPILAGLLSYPQKISQTSSYHCRRNTILRLA